MDGASDNMAHSFVNHNKKILVSTGSVTTFVLKKAFRLLDFGW